MNSLQKIHELGYFTDVNHCRFYRDYADTNTYVDDYYCVPRRVNMPDMQHLALSKVEANQLELHPLDMLSCGGVTHLLVYNEDGIETESFACCSLSDNYNKRIGIEIAAARALQTILDKQKGRTHGQLA